MRRLACFVFVANLIALGPTVHAQTAACDPSQPVLPGNLGWPKDASVTVYVDPTLQSAESGEISTAFSNWTNAGNSGVQFTIVYNAGNAATPPSGSIGVVSGPVGQNRGKNAWKADADGRMVKSTITMDPSLTGAAFGRVLAHEVGHSFGLGEWTTGTDSIMANPVSATTPPGPNACDKKVVNLNGSYGKPGGPGGPGGTGTPTGCTMCAYHNCWVITRTRYGDTETVTQCADSQACCKKTTLSEGETFSCETWILRTGASCMNDGECCQNPQDNTPATCETVGMFSSQESCLAANDYCVLQEAVSVSAEVGNMICWDGAPTPLQSCGAMGGEYCSGAASSCPGGYDNLGQSNDCAACCNLVDPCADPATHSHSGSCGSSDSCGHVFGVPSDCWSCGNGICEGGESASGCADCQGDGYCEPNMEGCGTSPDCPCWMAGTTCSTSGPSGECVDRCSDPAFHNHSGSCGQADECGHPIGTAQECLPSCGAMGGDYCSQTNDWCPGGHGYLGQSYDCASCCQADPCASPYTHDHGGSCGSTDSCGHSFGSNEDCGCPGAPTEYDTCWDYVCDTEWSWVPEYCDTCEQQCTTEWSCWTNCEWDYCWDECVPYESCSNNCYSYECGGYWAPSDNNCRWEPYQCNPHQCGY